MAFDQGLVDWIVEAMEPMGTVTLRKMMGGATLYLDGTIFAIVDDDAVWFKADAVSDAEWDEAGCPRFTYAMREGRIETMNYRRAPDDVYDDAEAMRDWAARGVAAGLRNPSKKRAAKSRR
jgi:DNA transformation protein